MNGLVASSEIVTGYCPLVVPYETEYFLARSDFVQVIVIEPLLGCAVAANGPGLKFSVNVPVENPPFVHPKQKNINKNKRFTPIPRL